MSVKRPVLVAVMVLVVLIALGPLVLRPNTQALGHDSVLQTNTVNGESSISIDPGNGIYMVDAWPSQWFTPSYSLNGGASWHNGTQAPIGGWTTGVATGDPWTAVGPDGTDYFTTYYNNTQDLVAYMATSIDHGKTWSIDLNYFASAANNSATTWTLWNGTTTSGCYSSDLHFVGDQEKIAVDSSASSPFKGYVYIIGDFGVLLNGVCTIQDGLIRSRDGGSTWDLHLTTNPTPLASETEQLGIGSNGEIYFARFYNESDLIFEKSKDGGATWSYRLIGGSNIEGYSVNLAVSTSGTPYIVYMRCLTTCTPASNGSSSIYLISSSDDGNIWSSGTQISDNAALPYWTYVPLVCGVYTDCEPEHRPPTITMSSLGVIVAWTDWRNSNNNTNADIYAYIPGSSTNVRLTTFPGRLCNQLKTIACTWNGNDFMSSAASSRGVYLAFGVDSDGNPPTSGDVIDAVVIMITGTGTACSVAGTTVQMSIQVCVLASPYVAVAAAVSAVAIGIVLVKSRRLPPDTASQSVGQP
jgi:hypothetical protein